MSTDFRPAEQEWIAYLEGRLGGERLERFEAWLTADPGARRELEQLQLLMADLEDLPPYPVSAELLDDSRSRLASTLRTLKQHGQTLSAFRPAATGEQAPLRRRTDRPSPRPAFWVPVAVAASLVLGIWMGRSSFWFPGGAAREAALRYGPAGLSPAGLVDDGGLSGWESTNRKRQFAVQDLDDHADREVSIQQDETSRYEISGSAQDRGIQEYLSYIVRNDANPERRLTAIRLLQQNEPGAGVQELLVYALTHDPDAGVRRSAASALLSRVDEPRVRQSFLKVMVDDPLPELRNLAAKVLSAGERAVEDHEGQTRWKAAEVEDGPGGAAGNDAPHGGGSEFGR